MLKQDIQSVGVIGSGFSGLSAACYLANQGNEVTIYEKNSEVGGRARKFSEKGFVFDMGPSWYWMPDIFENFFKDFAKSASDYYQLEKLSPSFQIFFDQKDPLIIPSELNELYALFESIEKGSAKKLERFLKEGEVKYRIAMQHLIYKPALSWTEYASWDVLAGAMVSNMFQSMSTYVRSFFKDPRLISLMEFPVIFLGAPPNKIPALYSLMNYSAFSSGTWYPQGGMFKIVDALKDLAQSLNAEIRTNSPVSQIVTENKAAVGVEVNNKFFEHDALIASADYNHVEQVLLQASERNYKTAYWDKKTMAPSCIIFYVGVNKKIPKLLHHNLFFDSNFAAHTSQLYTSPQWPDDPLFYLCCPSKTDPTVAPYGMENLFFLIPIAAGLKDEEELREQYFDNLISRVEKVSGESIKEFIIYKKSYCINDFAADYNAYKGNAYGLANTLNQTAVLKPSLKNKKLKNLFYTGQLTVPGPGVPPALISGKIAAGEALKYLSTKKSLVRERVI